MSVFRHREGPILEDEGHPELADRSFFQHEAASEHWFPSYDAVSLDLSAEMIDNAVHFLNAAETVAGAFGKSVTIETNSAKCGWLQVEPGDAGDCWRTGWTSFAIRVLDGVGSVRWFAVYDYDPSQIGTDWITREQLLAMREGIAPNQ